jgi:hypothetical protein
MTIVLRSFAILVIGLVVQSAWGQSSPSSADILQMLRPAGTSSCFATARRIPTRPTPIRCTMLMSPSSAS